MTLRTQRSRPGLVPGLLLLAGVSLSGCGRENDIDRYGQLAPSVNKDAADGQFSSRFNQSLRADPNSEPMNIAEGDLPPVDLTKEPVDVQ